MYPPVGSLVILQARKAVNALTSELNVLVSGEPDNLARPEL
jgi:hypothetical protein